MQTDNKELIDMLQGNKAGDIDELIKPDTENSLTEAVDDNKIVVPPNPNKTKAPKQTQEESAARLRADRDEARRKTQELEEKLKDLPKKDAVFDKVKKLINKDDFTDEDLDAVIGDYSFSKKQIETLLDQIKEKDQRIRDFDITSSSEWNEQYASPLKQAAESLGAELVPIVNGEPVNNDRAGMVLKNLLDSGDITPTSVKIALHKIKDIYEDDGVDYEMPSVNSIFKGIKEVISLKEKANKAYTEWELEKASGAADDNELRSAREEAKRAKMRKQRTATTRGYLAEFIESEDAEYIMEDHGYDETTGIIVAAHNELTEIMDNPDKAPTYREMLEWKSKAMLYGKVIESMKQRGKIARAGTSKAKIENVGHKEVASSDDVNPNVKLLKEMGVK